LVFLLRSILSAQIYQYVAIIPQPTPTRKLMCYRKGAPYTGLILSTPASTTLRGFDSERP